MNKNAGRAGIATLVVTLSGGAFPWIAGVDRVVQLDQYMDGMPIWFRVCTTGAFGACEVSPPYTQPAGTTVHLEIPMRFRPGRKTVTVESCNADGCAEPVTVDAEIPIQWELPNER